MALTIPLAGELTRRITLFKRVDLPSAELGAYSSDTVIGSFWAKIEPVGGMYFMQGLQQNQTITHRVWLRWIKGKTDEHSLTHGVMLKCQGIVYEIIRVMDADNTRRFTVLEVQELGENVAELGTSLLGDVLNG